MNEFSFKLPDLGEGIVESEIVAWHIDVGDVVAQDQLIAEIQTDKAIVEATSPVGGRVLKLGCNAGELLAVGSELVLLATDENQTNAERRSEQAATPASPSAKKTPEQAIAAPQAQQPPSTKQPIPSATKSCESTQILTSPSVRLRARQNNIDLNKVTGRGPSGRISHQDIDDYLLHNKTATATKTEAPGNTTNTTKEKPSVATKSAKPNNNKTNTDQTDELRRYPLKGTRRIIAQKLQQAAQTIPHYSYVEEVDVTALEQYRGQLNQNRDDSQSKLTLLPFIIRALVTTLPQFPHCNAHFDNDRGEVSEYQAVHIGMATMTAAGLMVPVIRHCEQKSLWQYAAEIETLASAARNQTLAAEQLTGSTITITSLGKLGGIASTPIINAPETSVIAINKIQQRPVIIDEAIAIHSVMNISASFDHRIVDGFDGASLVQAIKHELEHPEQ